VPQSTYISSEVGPRSINLYVQSFVIIKRVNNESSEWRE